MDRRVATYTPRGSNLLLREYLRRTWAFRRFVVAYAWADLREDFLRNRLGVAWVVLNPLLLAGTYAVLVTVIRGSSDAAELLAFVTSGLFLFLFVRDAVVQSASSLVRGSSLLLASDLPKLALPAAAALTSLITFAISMATYVPFHFAADRPVHIDQLQIVAIALLATAFALGAGSAAAFAAARWRDLRSVLPFLLRLVLYVSPVLYTIDDLRTSFSGAARAVFWLNPLVPYFDAWQRVLNADVVPVRLWAQMGGWATTALSIGVFVAFRRQHSIGAHL